MPELATELLSEARTESLAARKEVYGAWMEGEQVYTISGEGRVYVWQWAKASEAYKHAQEVDYTRRIGKRKDCTMDERLILLNKYQLTNEGTSRISAADMSGPMLAVGFRSGSFAIYKVSEKSIDNVQTISMSDFEITSITASPDWIVIASESLGQVLVWEWKSETYVIKQ